MCANATIPLSSPPARAFYGGLLGCEEGRSSKTWIDFNLMGHQVRPTCRALLVKDAAPRRSPRSSRSRPNALPAQLVTHWANDEYRGPKYYNGVDHDMVPVPHFGVCLTVDAFKVLAAKLQAAGVKFILEPTLRRVRARRRARGSRAVTVRQLGCPVRRERRSNVRAVGSASPQFDRFQGKKGEQWTMFLADPSENSIEFKGELRAGAPSSSGGVGALELSMQDVCGAMLMFARTRV